MRNFYKVDAFFIFSVCRKISVEWVFVYWFCCQEKKNMEGYSRKEEKCNKLFDLVPKESEWLLKKEGTSHGVSEEKKLELRLGPPDGDWSVKDSSKLRGRDDSHLSFTYFSSATAKRGFLDPVNGGQPHQFSSFLRLQSPSQCMHVRPQESSRPGCSKGVDLNSLEKKAFSPPAAKASTAVPNTSQKRFLSHCFVLLSGQIIFTVLVVLAQWFYKSFMSVADIYFLFLVLFLVIIL